MGDGAAGDVQGIGDRHAKVPGEVVVAGARGPQRRVARAGQAGAPWQPGRQDAERFQRVRGVRAGQPMVPVAALRHDRDQPGVHQPGQVAAGGLRRDPAAA